VIPLPLLLVLALAAPLFLWSVEYLLPYPYIVEELFKAGLVYYPPKDSSFKNVFFLDLVFSLSESMMYLFNFLSLGSFQGLGGRLILTSGLHSLTFFLYFWGRRFLILMLPMAALIHYLFNLLV
jgi:hypothetical protein